MLVPEGHRVDVGHVRPGDGVRQHEVTARRQDIHQTPHDPAGLLVVLDEHDDSQQDQCHETAEFEQFPGLRQDRVGVAQVLVEAGRTALGRTGQQGRRTGQDDRIVVDGDDTGLGGEPLGDLRVVGGGQTGADVEELPYAALGHRIPHRTVEELPVRAGVRADAGVEPADLLSHLLIDDVVVLAAQPVVPDPGRVRQIGPGLFVRLTGGGGLGHATLPCETVGSQVGTCPKKSGGARTGTPRGAGDRHTARSVGRRHPEGDTTGTPTSRRGERRRVTR